MIRLLFMVAMLQAGLAPLVAWAAAGDLSIIRGQIDAGRWREASQEITRQLNQPDLGFLARDALLFEQERMRRMRLDFSKTREQVFAEAHRIAPGLDESLFGRWERAGALEFLNIDGQPCYFHSTAANLFRVSAEARALQGRPRGQNPAPPHRLTNLRQILACFDKTGEATNTPKVFRVAYRLTVNAGAVPPGQTIRAWLPLPHPGGRQELLGGVTTDPRLHVLSPGTAALRSVYLEKPAEAGRPTTFSVSYDYSCSGSCRKIDPRQVRPVSAQDGGLAPFLAERPPHIVFDDEVRSLSRAIVGDESNPCLRARLLFQWVYEHVPWASAREYSTIESLPRYALAHRWGDCGIKTMLFMTLCRLNGIPTRWVSGWITGPDKDMHDWCEIYLEPYGWVPADVTYGLTASDDERERWFFLGGIDSYRLVVNTDYGQPLYPAKIHFRSEIVDFQRGEVEWRGGNLYFDQWNYEFGVEELPARTQPRPTAEHEATSPK